MISILDRNQIIIDSVINKNNSMKLSLSKYHNSKPKLQSMYKLQFSSL